MDNQRQRTILIHYSEIGLKGANQPKFRRQLRDNIRLKLKTLGLNWPVYEKPGCLWIPVPGSAGVSPAVPASTDAGETPALPAQNNVDSVERCLASLKEVFDVAWFAITEPLPHRSFKGSS